MSQVPPVPEIPRSPFLPRVSVETKWGTPQTSVPICQQQNGPIPSPARALSEEVRLIRSSFTTQCQKYPGFNPKSLSYQNQKYFNLNEKRQSIDEIVNKK